MGMLFGRQAAPVDLRNLYFNTPAPQTLQAPKRSLTQKTQDTIADKLRGVVGKRTADKVAGLFDMTPAAGLTGAYDAGAALRQNQKMKAAIGALTSALSVMPDGGAAAAKGAGLLHSIIAPLWHGSPKKFERFTLEHMGSGEGNQAYGHGLYFAENPSVASTYAVPRRAEPQDVPDDVRARLRGALGSQDYLGFDTFGGAINAVRAHRLDFDKRWEVDNADEIRNALKTYDDHRWLPSDRPTLYETKVNANPSDFASWDEMGPSSEHIARANGMAGVQFLDNHSRYGITSTPTRNYVVFDPSIIDILNRH